jgi:hypothetical protein
MKQHGITMEGEMTAAEFVELTKDAYGGDAIRQLVQ